MSLRSHAVILCFGDNARNRRQNAAILRRAEFDVWETDTGSEALRLARHRPDLVLLDVCLPDVSGFETCRQLRADPATASIPVLHLCSLADHSEERAQELEGGADGYLIKPVEPAELIAQVRLLLRLRRAEESLRESDERYRLIAENASAAIFMLDEQSTILFANPAAGKVFGYTAEELLQQKITRLMPEVVRGWHEAAVARYLTTGQRGVRWDGMEVKGRHKSGREIALEVSFGEFRDREGRRRFVGLARDVTARKEAEQALATVSRRLLEVQETERRHIARELHDEIGQGLTVLKIALHAAQQSVPGPRLETALGQVDRILQQVRTLSLELRPPMLENLGLESALRWLVSGVTEQTGLAVRLEVQTLSGRLPADMEMDCFRLVQEALTNVVKHARARHVHVKLLEQVGKLHLTIRDDGAGFDVEAARQKAMRGAGFGLLGMEERAKLRDGEFGIRSAPGQGTEVWVRLPVPEQAEERR